jgi:hypothetical protein
MPIPKPKKNEENNAFVSRCMSNETMKKDFPNNKQRIAVCLGQTKKTKAGLFSKVLEILQYTFGSNECYECLGYEEELTVGSLFVPMSEDYVDFVYDDEEDFDLSVLGSYVYKDPRTGEMYFYDNKGIQTKNGKPLVFIGKSNEYQGKKVKLNKPFRTPNGPKKFSAYTKNDNGNVVKVNFGDPNMEIKRDDPNRRKNFRARHNCDNPGPKWKARYWSCKMWSQTNVSDLT